MLSADGYLFFNSVGKYILRKCNSFLYLDANFIYLVLSSVLKLNI
jgi:hypothetical protein